jgi:hypothetical protein
MIDALKKFWHASSLPADCCRRVFSSSNTPFIRWAFDCVIVAVIVAAIVLDHFNHFFYRLKHPQSHPQHGGLLPLIGYAFLALLVLDVLRIGLGLAYLVTSERKKGGQFAIIDAEGQLHKIILPY